MADDSIVYCDSDEECFFGKVTEKERLRRIALGCSPVTCGTPKSILPDVLHGSSKVEMCNEPSATNKESEQFQSKHFPSVNSSFNESDIDEVIILDNENDCVQIISDGEGSFLKNEKGCGVNISETEHKTVSCIGTEFKETEVNDIENKNSLDKQDEICALQHILKDATEPENNSFDYTSLNRISDSVLDISHGSSLSDSVIDPGIKETENIKAKLAYEDISCDGDHHYYTATETEDLHMSVDEPDSQMKLSKQSESIVSQQSPSKLSCSSSMYYSAADFSVSQLPSSFHGYRGNLNDSDLFEKNGRDNDAEINNETSFELLAQCRQNSFTSIRTLSSCTKPKDDSRKEIQSRVISKLPVYNGSSSLLKPPKLNVKAETLQAHSLKWAKSLGKGVAKEGSSSSTVKMGENIPSTISMPKLQVACKKTPKAVCKTPTTEQNVKSTNPKMLKPGTKIHRSNEKQVEDFNKKSLLSLERKKYEHVISPIRAYITGSTVVLHKKAQVDSNLLPNSNSLKKNLSHIPKRTPLKISKAVQKLNFGNHDTRENIDPNVCSRDTLPPKFVEASEAVFIKEPELPRRHFPKMGENMQKLLDTPRPKITVHQGQVRELPQTKGVLIPNPKFSPSHNDSNQAGGRISVRVVKSAEKTDSFC